MLVAALERPNRLLEERDRPFRVALLDQLEPLVVEGEGIVGRLGGGLGRWCLRVGVRRRRLFLWRGRLFLRRRRIVLRAGVAVGLGDRLRCGRILVAADRVGEGESGDERHQAERGHRDPSRRPAHRGRRLVRRPRRPFLLGLRLRFRLGLRLRFRFGEHLRRRSGVEHGERSHRGLGPELRVLRAQALGEADQPSRALVAQALRKQDAAGEQVAPLARRLAAPELGRHVAGGARDLAGLRDRGRVLRAGHAEIRHAGAAVTIEQHVPRLDVSVDDPGGVDVRERAEHVGGQTLRVGLAAGVDPVLKRATGHVGHHQVRALDVRVEVVDRDQVGVLQPRGDPRLAPEPGEPGAVLDQPFGQDLDRHGTLQQRVVREPDARGCSRAQPAFELVAA